MSDRGERVDDYLAPAATLDQRLWSWDEEGEVITWSPPVGRPGEGTTIVFRTELHSLLSDFAPRGLPPLGAVIMALAAARGDWWNTTGEQVLTGEATWNVVDREEIRAGLNLIAGLPDDKRNSTDARRALLWTLFDSTPPATTPELATQVLAQLGRTDFMPPPARKSSRSRDADIAALRGGLRRFVIQGVTDNLGEQLDTGLPELPIAAELPNVPDRIRSLVSELLGDREFAGFARAVQDVLAATTIPRHVQESDELPTGGVSDISNRGPVERLLLSELANDPDVLAVRLALDEALYLRREAPPREPPHERTILIDCGLRTWGVPRVFATAVGMALAAEGVGTEEVGAYLGGESLTPTELHHRDGLVEHLTQLDLTLDVTELLPTFMAEVSSDAEPIVIVHEDCLDSPEFRTALDEAVASRTRARPLYVATVHESGRYRLSRWSRRGRLPVAEAQLDLANIVPSEQETATPLIDTTDLSELPEILRHETLPLRLPVQLTAHRALLTEFGAIGLTADGRMVRVLESAGPAIELSHAIPAGRVLWLGARFNRIHAVIADQKRDLHAVVHDLGSGETTITEHEAGVTMLAADFRLASNFGVLVRTSAGTQVRIYSLDRHAPITSFPVKRLSVEAPYPHALYFAGYGGRLTKIADAALNGEWLVEIGEINTQNLATAFDRPGSDWPWYITWAGEVRSTDPAVDAAIASIDGQLQAVSSDGQRVQVSEPNGSYVFDLAHQVRERFTNHRVALDPELQPYLCTSTPPHRLSRVTISASGGLTVEGMRGLPQSILEPNPLVTASVPGLTHSARFESIGTIPGGRVRLGRATLHDGSQIFLDHRGLLHLVSSQPSVPQITLGTSRRDQVAFVAPATSLTLSDDESNRVGRRRLLEALRSFTQVVFA